MSIGIISVLPIAAQASPETDYDAIAANVDLAVNVMLYKQNRPLDDDEADRIRVMSFTTQVLKPSLSKLETNLLFACAVKDIYQETAHNLMIDHRINVNPAIVYSHARHRYLDNRFPEKSGLSMKKLMKIEKKRRKYRRRLMTDNRYIPHKDIRDGTEILPQIRLPETKMKVSSLCLTELNLAIEKHQPAIADYVTETLNSKIVAKTN